MGNHVGEFAALLTTVFWTITALAFENASKRIGSLHLNILRLGIATVFLAVFSFFHRGLLFPIDADLHTWVWLALSGLVGFVIGDYLLFQAFIITGARIGMLMMTLAPVFAAFAAFLLLGEKMGIRSIFAMLITLSGIALVVFTRTRGDEKLPGKKGRNFSISYPIKGLFYGLGAAAGQGIGLVLSKYGMRNFDPFAASQIRVIAGFIGFGMLFSILRKWKELPSSVRDPKAMKFVLIGSVFGPFLGVSFSLIAVQHTDAGIAQTIMSLVPVLIIAPAVLINKEKLYIREVIGALIAVFGVALFFL